MKKETLISILKSLAECSNQCDQGICNPTVASFTRQTSVCVCMYLYHTDYFSAYFHHHPRRLLFLTWNGLVCLLHSLFLISTGLYCPILNCLWLFDCVSRYKYKILAQHTNALLLEMIVKVKQIRWNALLPSCNHRLIIQRDIYKPRGLLFCKLFKDEETERRRGLKKSRKGRYFW